MKGFAVPFVRSKALFPISNTRGCKEIRFLYTPFFMIFLIINIKTTGYIIFTKRPARRALSPHTFIDAISPVIKGATEHPTSPKIATVLYIAPLPSGNFFAASSTVPGQSVLIANPQREHPARDIKGFFERAAAR